MSFVITNKIKNAMKKIERIAHFVATLNGDGVTRVILSLIEEAEKNGIQSVIVTGWAKDGLISPEKVILLPSVSFPFYPEYKIPSLNVVGFENELTEFMPDIIHVHSPDTTAWVALKYAKGHMIPVICTYHTNFSRYLTYYHVSPLEPFLWMYLKNLYEHFQIITTPSETVTLELENLGLNNIKTIHWGVDQNKFNSSYVSKEWREKITLGKNKTIVLCVCRLTWEKDLRTLAKAYKLLKAKRDDFVMVVAGDGPNRKDLELLMPGAIFLGQIEGRELSETYASSDLLFFPSSTEVFANVPLEAMSSGIIPILADFGAIKGLIQNKQIGLLCKPKDAQDFFEKMDILLNNPETQEIMCVNGRNFIKEFTWEKVFNEIINLYSSVRYR